MDMKVPMAREPPAFRKAQVSPLDLKYKRLETAIMRLEHELKRKRIKVDDACKDIITYIQEGARMDHMVSPSASASNPYTRQSTGCCAIM